MSPWYRFWKNLALGLAKLLWGLRVAGFENVPREGPVLVTSNHVSNLDPPIVGAIVPFEAGFAAKKELFAVPGLGSLIRSLNAIPVDRSQVSVATMRKFGEFLERGKSLVFFPEGTRGKEGRLRRPKLGVGMVLARHPVTILPVFVEGTDAPVRNLFRRGRVRVTFGRPYTLPKDGSRTGDRRDQYRQTAELVMDHIRSLRPPESEGDGAPRVETRD